MKVQVTTDNSLCHFCETGVLNDNKGDLTFILTGTNTKTPIRLCDACLTYVADKFLAIIEAGVKATKIENAEIITEVKDVGRHKE